MVTTEARDDVYLIERGHMVAFARIISFRCLLTKCSFSRPTRGKGKGKKDTACVLKEFKLASAWVKSLELL